MEIPGFVFVIIGILMAGLSVYINVSQGSAAMTLFIIAGTILIAWGIIKVIMQKGKGEGRGAVYPSQRQYNQQEQRSQQMQYSQQQQPFQQQQWQRYRKH